ncbi:cell wall-binding repeat-containing protein [Candidatus Poriferisodalis sp.]|uniref:cell wall-binding repeat-containing protein n=1 Tax=Candidatus Poriferisodalis sp. TaxID=3101277 RepID=UPI003B01CD93
MAVAVVALVAAATVAFPVGAQALDRGSPMQTVRISNGLYLFWYEVAGATGYDVQMRSLGSDNTWQQWNSVDYSGTYQPLIVTGLVSGTKYQWRVRAKNGTQTGPWSPTDDDTDPAYNQTVTAFGSGVPNAPIITAVSGTAQSITVGWIPGESRSGVAADGWVVSYFWYDENDQYHIRRSERLAASARTHTFNVATGVDVEYEVFVRSYAGTRAAGASSNVVCVIPNRVHAAPHTRLPPPRTPTQNPTPQPTPTTPTTQPPPDNDNPPPDNNEDPPPDNNEDPPPDNDNPPPDNNDNPPPNNDNPPPNNDNPPPNNENPPPNNENPPPGNENPPPGNDSPPPGDADVPQSDDPGDPPSRTPRGKWRDVDVERVGGPDRITTGVTVAETYAERRRNAGDDIDSVIVATSLRFPDALSASSLAGLIDAPILLTELDRLSKPTAEFIEAHGIERVFIMGEHEAVSYKVQRAIEALEPVREVIRLGGADRYETSVKIAEYVGTPGSFCGTNRRTVLLATGTKFPDALAAAPVAAVGKHSLLLSYPDRLPPLVRTHLHQGALEGSIDRVVIVGETSAVSRSVEQMLARLGLITVRVGGADRYDTAALLAKYAVDDTSPTPAGCLGNKAAAIVTGRTFADALVAGPLIAYAQGPTLLLNPPSFIPAPVVRVLRAGIFDREAVELVVVGGRRALPDQQVKWVRDILRRAD